MVFFLHVVVTGIMFGGILGLVALGFVIVFRCTEIFNLAQGGFVLLGGYVFWSLLVQFGLPFWSSIILTIVIMCIGGIILGKFPFQRMAGQSPDARFMVSLGLFAFLPGIVDMIWGGNIKSYPQLLPVKPITLGFINIAIEPLCAFAVSLVIFALLSIFLRFTKAGLRFRAVAESHKIAQSLGVSVNNAIGISIAIACGVIGVACGILYGIVRSLDLSLATIALDGLAVALFGGLHSMSGAIIAGIIIGVLEALVGAYISFTLSAVVPYIVIVLVLLFRPNGLFGLKNVERI